jgi:hypothetical protein
MAGALLYDPARVRVLALKTAAAIQWLDARMSGEPIADDPIATLRRISHTLGTTWMPYLAHLLGDTSMLSWDAATPAAPPAPALGFRSAGSADDDRRPDQIAAEMVELADRAADGDAAALLELDQMLSTYEDDPAVIYEFWQQLGDEGLTELVVELETGTRFLGQGLLATSEVLAARDRVLAVMMPTPLSIPSDPDFELATAIVQGNNTEWENLLNAGCVDLGGSDADYGGGGLVVGPDGRPYPIVIPLVSDGDQTYTGEIEPVAEGERSVNDLNGSDDGWVPRWYQSGIERFQTRPSTIDRILGFAAGTTGLVTPLPPNQGLQFIQMRPGMPPCLSQTPATSPPPIASARPNATDTVAVVPNGPAVIAASVRGADGLVYAANMDNQRERAYQVIFEEHPETGRRRARIETFTIGTDEAGNVVIIPEHVWVDHDDGTLMSQGICYTLENPSGVLTDVTPLAFDPDVAPNAYAIPDQAFP